MLDNSCMGPSRNVSGEIDTSGAGSMNVSSGCSADEFHSCQSMPESRLALLLGRAGFKLFAKFTADGI